MDLPPLKPSPLTRRRLLCDTGMGFGLRGGRVQFALDEDLLTATDHFAGRLKVSRSTLVRNALRAHLKKLYYQDLERLEQPLLGAVQLV